MSETSIGDLVRRIRRELEDEPWEDYTTDAVPTGGPLVVVNQGDAWAEGDVGEWDDDSFEQFKVRETDGVDSLMVKPGHNDTSQVAHATGATVLKNPKVNGWMIVNVLEETLAELWPYGWAVRSTTLTPVSTQTYYTLPADFVDLVSVSQKQTGTATAYFHYATRDSDFPVSVIRNLPVSDVGSGMALYVPFLENTTNDLTVRYRGELTMSDIEDGLMATTMVYGALAKLTMAQDTVVIRQQIPQNAVSGLRQSFGYQARYEDARRRLRYSLERAGLGPARVYVG